MPATVASFQDHFISRPLRVLAPPTAEPPGASVVSRSAPYSLPLGDSRASYESQAVEGCEPIVTDRRGTLWAAILGSGIVFLDSSVLTVALPRIARDLPAHVVGTLEGESYVYNGYLLGESAFLILAGWLTDVHGRRRIFTLGLAAFGASSLLSGFAPSLEWLIVLRVLQGTSGALIVPGSLALVTASFSGEEQGRAFGVWSGASAGVAVLGPMLGGLLVDPLRHRCAGHWRHRDDLVALVDAPRIRSTRSTGAVPLPQFHGDESFDARHLRRPRGHVLLLDVVSPGDSRVFSGGGRGRHDAGRASPSVVFVATRCAVRPLRRALALDDRPGPHGPRCPLAFAHPLHEPGVGPGRGCSDVHTA